MFWGNDILADRLPALMPDYDPQRLDQGAYRLRIGDEVYVSPTGEKGDRKNKPKTKLSDGQPFTIPAGQFAFLLTQERVTVPADAIAFISVRAKYKFMGLVNVSGFHVDPHYTGKLIFAVFNAGPGVVHLRQGEECFQIWFADAKGNDSLRQKVGHTEIPSGLITGLGETLHTLAGLNTKITKIQNEQTFIKATATVLAAVIIGLVTYFLRDALDRPGNVHDGATQQVETVPVKSDPPAPSPNSEEPKGRK